MKKYLSILLVAHCWFPAANVKVLKSNDPELKYNKKVEYFEKEDFMRATTLSMR